LKPVLRASQARRFALHGLEGSQGRQPRWRRLQALSGEEPRHREVHTTIGALVTGWRTFDIANGWGGRHPVNVPVFVVTHLVPQEWVYEGSPFTFVTDGVQSAIEQAKAVAGDKDVAVGAASIVQ
jgi:dihydrofolate reductase